MILTNDTAQVAWVKEALVYDPNAADLWYGLVNLALLTKDEPVYNAAIEQLKRLTPKVAYGAVVVEH